jgi:hypothetical protein
MGILMGISMAKAMGIPMAIPMGIAKPFRIIARAAACTYFPQM